MSLSGCVRPHDDGCILIVRVTPKSAKDAIEGVAQDDAGRSYLKVRVRAVPENGAANKAVCKLIAKSLGLPKSAVSLHAGETARVKQVFVATTAEDISCRLKG